jgi:hypothetical protein
MCYKNLAMALSTLDALWQEVQKELRKVINEDNEK